MDFCTTPAHLLHSAINWALLLAAYGLAAGTTLSNWLKNDHFQKHYSYDILPNLIELK